MMDKDLIITRTSEHVRKLLEGEGTGHDWWHVRRVWNNALAIGRAEQADLFVVQLAALLHDIGDWKFHNGDESVGPRMAREWLESLGVDEATTAHVCEIIEGLSFKGSGTPSMMKTLEGKVTQDADRLDAIGAIGIARAFAYGGFKQRDLHNPSLMPKRHASFEEYKKSTGPTINHFYEKLLLLKDLMNTPTARRMAEERHRFMEEYVKRFLDEWDGRA